MKLKLYYYQGYIYNNPEPTIIRNVYSDGNRLYIRTRKYGDVEVSEISFGRYKYA